MIVNYTQEDLIKHVVTAQNIVKEHLAAGRVADALESYKNSSMRYTQLSKLVAENGYSRELCLDITAQTGGTGFMLDDGEPLISLSELTMTISYKIEKQDYDIFKQRFIQSCNDLKDLRQDVENEWVKIYTGTPIALTNTNGGGFLDDIVYGLGTFVIPMKRFVSMDFQIVPFQNLFELRPGKKVVEYIEGQPNDHIEKHFSDYLNLVIIMPYETDDIDTLLNVGCETYLDMFCDAYEHDYRVHKIIEKELPTLPKV